MYIYIYIYIYIYMLFTEKTINLQYIIYLHNESVLLFESSSVQLRSNQDLEGPQCPNYCLSCK